MFFLRTMIRRTRRTCRERGRGVIDIVLVTGRKLYFVLPEVGDFVKNEDQSEKVLSSFVGDGSLKILMLMVFVKCFRLMESLSCSVFT